MGREPWSLTSSRVMALKEEGRKCRCTGLTEWANFAKARSTKLWNLTIIDYTFKNDCLDYFNSSPNNKKI